MNAMRLTRRGLMRAMARVVLGTGVTGLAGGAYATGVEPVWLTIQPVTLRLPRLRPAFHGYRLVQLSDLHADDSLDHHQLAEVVRLTNAQAPDLIAITGDFVTRRPAAVAAELTTALGALRARDGVVAVLGNHDHWTEPALVRAMLRNAGVVELANRTMTLERGGALLHLAGVDDVWAGQARLDQVLARLPAEGAAILLVHEPDYADISAATGRFDLQLAGHSHGGQVIVPLLGPPILPLLGRRYPLGRYQVGPMIQYTNRGIGVVPAASRYLGPLRPRLRFNCRPEITVMTLET